VARLNEMSSSLATKFNDIAREKIIEYDNKVNALQNDYNQQLTNIRDKFDQDNKKQTNSAGANITKLTYMEDQNRLRNVLNNNIHKLFDELMRQIDAACKHIIDGIDEEQKEFASKYSKDRENYAREVDRLEKEFDETYKHNIKMLEK
jgi:hypothetical protein